MSKNKTATLIALFLIFAMAFSLIALPTGNAHDPAWTVPTYAFISVEPNPVGVGQQAYVNFWVDRPPPTAGRQYGDRWHGFTVKVTDPDGNTKQLGTTYTSDATGGAHATFTPDKLGTYTFVFNFPGQTITGENPDPAYGSEGRAAEFIGDYYEPSTSREAKLEVQQEPVEYLPSVPLPTEYWERPIYSENLDWYKISGNWFGFSMQSHGGAYYNISGNFNPYTTGPNSAHVIWAKSLSPGGIIGGEFGGDEYGSSYYSTPQYEPRFHGIVIQGILYYKRVPGSSTYPEGWVAVNIRTGEEVWTKDTTNSMVCGQVLKYVSPNQFGGLAYLWDYEPTVAPNTGTTYGLYEPTTGNWILNIVNATRFSKIVEDESGSLLGYYTNSTDNTLCMWNSTKCIQGPNPGGFWSWRPPQGAEIPFEWGIQMVAPLADTYQGEPIDASFSIMTMSSDIVLLQAEEGASAFLPGSGRKFWAGYDALTGDKLWGPIEHEYLAYARIKDSPAMQGYVFELTHPTMTWEAFSLETGKKVWGPTEPYTSPWGYFVAYDPIAAYGMLYESDFGGYVHAYDITTGKEEWTFFTGESGYETPYGSYPLYHVAAVADGKVYVQGGHTYSPPLFRGSQFWCLNATTGEKVWSVSSFTMSNQQAEVIADGVLVVPNAYDDRIYAYSKGRSATTVSAPDIAQPLGTQMLITGTVTDQSPGDTCLGVPAAGTPAISDESMTEWMEYLYMQQPKPTNATGVEVTVSVVDPNNNCYNVGTTTSNDDGKYGVEFTPEVPGKYMVIATFGGSESYYSSYSTTYLSVSEAPAATPEPTPVAQEPVGMYLTGSTIAIIVAIAIVAIILLRRR